MVLIKVVLFAVRNNLEEFSHVALIKIRTNCIRSARWQSDNAFVSGAGGLRFKSDTGLPTVRYRCNVSSKGAVLPGRNDAEMGHTNSLHASA